MRRHLDADMEIAYEDYKTQLLREGNSFLCFKSFSRIFPYKKMDKIMDK